MKNTCHSELVSESKDMTDLPPHPSPLPQGARERTRVAFTLAEVLITLGIIGVVAAMTIPNLITAHQKKVTVTKLQKAISVLNQAYRLSNEENGMISPSDTYLMNPQTYYETYWAPYIKNSEYCRNNWDAQTNTCYSSHSPFSWLNPNLAPNTIWYINDVLRTAFITPDGFFYSIALASWCNGTAEGGKCVVSNIAVDINGPKGPNVFGKDVFQLERPKDGIGSIVPSGSQFTDAQINDNCKKNGGDGTYCAEKIRRAGWQIDKSYPW